MELHAAEIAVPHDGAEILPVRTAGQCPVAQRRRVRMDEVEPLPVESAGQRVVAGCRDGVPAHVGHAQVGPVRESLEPGRHQAEQVGVVLFRRREQQLHAQADPQHRLLQGPQGIH